MSIECLGAVMPVKYSYIGNVTLPLGVVGVGVGGLNHEAWLSCTISLPTIHVFQYSIHWGSKAARAEVLHKACTAIGLIPAVKHSGSNWLLNRQDIYSPWPAGEAYRSIREFSDFILFEFYQWGPGMFGSRAAFYQASIHKIHLRVAAALAKSHGIRMGAS